MCYCLISFHLSCHLPLPLSPYLHLSMPGKRAAVGQADVSLSLSLSRSLSLSLSLSFSLFLSLSLSGPRGVSQGACHLQLTSNPPQQGINSHTHRIRYFPHLNAAIHSTG